MKLAETLTESAWQSQVVGVARQFGWEAFHAPDNRPGRNGRVQAVAPGWPDLVLLGHSRALFVELKSQTGRVRPEQTQTLERLAAAGCECAIWRPSDLATVLKVLGPSQQSLRQETAA